MSLTDKYQEMLGIQPIWGARDALVPAIHVFLV